MILFTFLACFAWTNPEETKVLLQQLIGFPSILKACCVVLTYSLILWVHQPAITFETAQTPSLQVESWISGDPRNFSLIAEPRPIPVSNIAVDCSYRSFTECFSICNELLPETSRDGEGWLRAREERRLCRDDCFESVCWL
jgi:hypothetical protein